MQGDDSLRKRFINEHYLTRRGLEAKLDLKKRNLTTEVAKVKRLAKCGEIFYSKRMDRI